MMKEANTCVEDHFVDINEMVKIGKNRSQIMSLRVFNCKYGLGN